MRIELNIELDIGPQEATQHPGQIRDHAVQVEHRGLKYLLPGERQELTGNPGCPGRRFHHLGHIGAMRVLLW